jgi:hypothetical protein
MRPAGNALAYSENRPVRDLRLVGRSLGFRPLMYPYVAPHTTKFTRPSHLLFAVAPNRLFFSSGSAARVGSIPIARSTLRQRQATQGYKVQDIDPMGKSWEIDAEGATVSWPHVSPHCPEIHTYGHTQQFTKINCVIPTLPS